MPKTNGTKRKSPSVERQLALALLRVIECAGLIDAAPGQDANALKTSIEEGIELLDANGYKDLESIPTRVKRIESAIAEAVKNQDGAALAKLGAELDRAKAGKPPLTTEKKPKAQRKPRTPKTPPANAPAASVCLSCNWKGTEVPGSACPDCGAAVLAKEG